MAEDDLPAMRPFWSGTITFGLVSVPVSLFPANRPRSISMRMVGPDDAPVQRRYICSKEGEPLEDDEIVRGFEIEKGKFVVVTDDELEAIEPRKSREIDLQLFVDVDEIDPILFERAYFLTPSGGSNKAYRLLATVMEKKRRAGIATFVMRSKEYLVAILAEKGILRAETLRFHDEVRSPKDVGLPAVKKPKPSEVKKFEQVISKKTGKVDFRQFLDDRAEKLEKLAAKKAQSNEAVIEAPSTDTESEGGEVIDLMAALRRSLGESATRRKPGRRAGPRGGTPENRSKSELLAEAGKRRIAGRSSMNKSELIAALRRG